MADSKANEIILPNRTNKGSYLVASRPVAICVLSPRFVTKTRENPEAKGFL